MESVECLGVVLVEITHAIREVRLDRLDEQVIVVAHEAIGMADPVVVFDRGRKLFEENFSVSIVVKNIFFAVTASGDVIERAWVGNTEWS